MSTRFRARAGAGTKKLRNALPAGLNAVAFAGRERSRPTCSGEGHQDEELLLKSFGCKYIFLSRPALSGQDQSASFGGFLDRVNGVGVKNTGPAIASGRSVLLVDLNNFATFPTLSVGILTASLRKAGIEVRLLSPLAHDVPAAERERAEGPTDHLKRRIHLSTYAPFLGARDRLRQARGWWAARPHPRVLAEVARALDERPDAILLSAYLQHHPSVARIGELARRAGVPMLVGGPVFNMPAIAETWLGIEGLSAIVGAECDLNIADIVETLCSGGDLLRFRGVTLPDGRTSGPASPLRDLDAVGVPDFTGFPWDRYRVRIVPLMASRGCQWNDCTFCSDVVSASGRTFRSRSVGSVLDEMREQSRRHDTANFLFLDLKLNSNPNLLRGIVENVQHEVPGAQWIGTVHVDTRADNGLSARELRAAAAAGMRRVSFGLEGASQRLLDAMRKGCTVERNAEFIRHAFEAGLSVRATMFKGYPGETAEDLEAAADFLERHASYLDRIRFNEFSITLGTPIADQLVADAPSLRGFAMNKVNGREGRIDYRAAANSGRTYRRAKARLLRAVYEINRRPIRSAARQFDGLM